VIEGGVVFEEVVGAEDDNNLVVLDEVFDVGVKFVLIEDGSVIIINNLYIGFIFC
jgi:hypothetical protein